MPTDLFPRESKKTEKSIIPRKPEKITEKTKGLQ